MVVVVVAAAEAAEAAVGGGDAGSGTAAAAVVEGVGSVLLLGVDIGPSQVRHLCVAHPHTRPRLTVTERETDTYQCVGKVRLYSARNPQG